MKRLTRALALVLALILAGCSAAAGAEKPDGRLLVAASFYTMADFTEKIAGGRARVVTLAPAGAEPHDWEPSARDIATLEEAELLVLNGAGFEHWAGGMLAALGEKAPPAVETAAAVSALEGETHDDRELDPHVWLDPVNAKAQMTAIRDALAALDPAGAEEYDANLRRWAGECDKLDREYRETLEPLPGREIVVAHAAFGYLCGRYGLTQVPVRGLSPEGEPDPARMAEIIDYAGSRAVKVVFFERTASPKVAEAIAREIGAQTAVLDPIEGLGEERAAAGADYFSVMRENLAQLAHALE